MKIQNPEVKDNLFRRLRRIEGQVRGVQGMLSEERDCREVMQQLAAIQSAVQGASRFFLQEYANACLVEMDASRKQGEAPRDLEKRREQLVQDMLDLLGKSP